MSTISKATFDNKEQSFFKTLREKVDNYMSDQRLYKEGLARIGTKAAILFTCLVGTYVTLVFFTPTTPVALLLCAVLGLTMAGIGFNVMHDGAHGSFSKKKWVNDLMGYSLNLLGGNVELWKIKHNFNHHTYTNIDGLDDDIDIRPFIRCTESQPKRWFHRFQHYYWAVLYGLTYILWVYVQDYRKYFSGKVGNIPFRKFSTKDHIIFWLTKVVYFGLFIGLPWYMVGFLPMLVGYLTTCIVCGFVIAVIFQLAHVVKDAHFPEFAQGQTTAKIEDEWAVHQIRTTANFATRSPIISWYTGGLNHQVEHHLFPRISHVHYPAINRMVMETCKQFGVKYIEYPSVLSALRSHVSYLKAVGA
jgi:linoleoyl-CoA desaturase